MADERPTKEPDKDTGPASDPSGQPDMMLPPPPPPVHEPERVTLGEKEKAVAKNLLRTMTLGYRNSTSPLANYDVLDRNQPLFHRYWIPAMERDPHLWYGFQMLRGPIISKAKYKVLSNNPDVEHFVDSHIKRFWTNGIPLTLTSMEYGYCGSEVLYRYNKQTGCIEYKGMKFIHPNHVRPVLHKSKLVGMRVFNIRRTANQFQSLKEKRYVPLPKCFWTVHERRAHRWYGRSRYQGAFIPWYETWQPKGFRNIRHLALYKYSFDGGIIKYPPGSVQDPETGEEIPNARIAQQMLDMREAGAGLALPSSFDGEGGWEYESPETPGIPETLFIYGDSLRDEKWEGIGVPPEVAKNEGTGSFAGRRVPQQAFYSFLQDIANEQLYDFDEQVLRFLVRLNYGEEEACSYDIEPIPILVTLQQEEMGVVTGKMPEQTDPNAMDQPLSNGRIEDRDSNAYNQQEQAMAQN